MNGFATPCQGVFRSGGSAAGITRRAIIAMLATMAVAPASAQPRPGPRRIVSLDDGLTETLLALDVKPVAIADRSSWEAWVVEPPLPPEIVDLGTLLEPNLEYLQQLRPDIILSIPYLDGIKQQLERIAPVRTIGLYVEDGHPYDRAVEATRLLAGMTGREAKGEALIAEAERTFTEIREEVAGFADRPIYFVHFLDPRNVRVYGAKGLVQAVLDKIGIRNAWAGDTNYWGFSATGIDGLATEADARLAYFEPLPAGATGTLTDSPVWKAMPFVRKRSILRLPAVQIFGALPSAMRLARVLADALAADASHG